MSATAAANSSVTEKASSPFSAADVLAYYERNARVNLSDRELIIEMGFLEWLLAKTNGRVGSTAARSRGGVRAPVPGRRETEIVILIANLIGGVIDGQD